MNVLCFDIGIKNLAWCLYNSDNKKILGWQNYDLINDGDVATVKEMYKCIVCNKNALYTNDTKYYCGKHTLKPIFKDVSGNVLKKMPKLDIIKEITKQTGKKEELFNYVKKNYSLVIEKKKSNQKAYDINKLHDSIRKFVLDNKKTLELATVIGLENQPVLKNPHMKTAQNFVFSCLKNILENCPHIKHIHASKKVKDKEKGDKGYKDRKLQSIEETKDFLKKTTQEQKYIEYFNNSLKKDDLSDALLMCIKFNE